MSYLSMGAKERELFRVDVYSSSISGDDVPSDLAIETAASVSCVISNTRDRNRSANSTTSRSVPASHKIDRPNDACSAELTFTEVSDEEEPVKRTRFCCRNGSPISVDSDGWHSLNQIPSREFERTWWLFCWGRSGNQNSF